MMTLSVEKRTDVTLLIIRISLGVVIFAHGAQKLLGWFGGFGYDGTMNYFTQTVGAPYLIGLLVILGESLGALALMIGLFGRLMSFAIFIIMSGALYFDHGKNGFYMNWYGNRPGGEGYEFDLLVFGLSLAIVLLGSGSYSIDHWISGKKKVSASVIP